jgi:uncharacterized protein (DUF2249 family)
MTATYQLGPDRILNAPEIPCVIKHGAILQAFVDLKVGAHFILRTGHDPVPLRYPFAAESPDAFIRAPVHRLPEAVAENFTKAKLVRPGRPAAVSGSCGDH